MLTSSKVFIKFNQEYRNWLSKCKNINIKKQHGSWRWYTVGQVLVWNVRVCYCSTYIKCENLKKKWTQSSSVENFLMFLKMFLQFFSLFVAFVPMFRTVMKKDETSFQKFIVILNTRYQHSIFCWWILRNVFETSIWSRPINHNVQVTLCMDCESRSVDILVLDFSKELSTKPCKKMITCIDYESIDF